MPARLKASHSGKWHFAKGSLHPAVLRRQRHGLGARRHHGHDGDGDDRERSHSARSGGVAPIDERRARRARGAAGEGRLTAIARFEDLIEPMTASAEARPNVSLRNATLSSHVFGLLARFT
jgi:hypothetical protein